MDTDLLKWCVEIAEYKNFTKVAEKHYISQQALSRQVIKLEELLNVSLFERNTRQVSVTPAGEAFVEEIKQALEHIDTACTKAKMFAQGFNGYLSIGCNGPSCRHNIIEVIKEYNAICPQIDIRLRNGTYSDIVDSFLIKNEFDLIAVGDFEPISSVTCNKIPCKAGAIFAVFSRNHPLAKKAEVTRQELLEEQLILLSLRNDTQTQARRHDRCRRILGRVPPKIKLVEDTDTINMLVSGGLGYTFLNSDLMNHYNTDIFSYVPIQGVLESHQTWLIWKKDISNPAFPRFLELAKKMIV